MQEVKVARLRDVTQPARDTKSVDRREHIETYIRGWKYSVPLMGSQISLRSAILGTSGMHHKFFDDVEWARRVRAKQAASVAAAKAGDMTAIADQMEVVRRMKEVS